MAFRLFNYFRESREELRKVVWPSRTETRNNTLLVIGITLFIAVFLGAIDIGLNFIIAKTLHQ
ncbi:MAG: preprotein translocase subunit SecE [Candidatus Kerfeldbacteria bacterium]|nr:preprotein translocase subunit SecE [Candidatus Kerfeldbacteria bacterium]